MCREEETTKQVWAIVILDPLCVTLLEAWRSFFLWSCGIFTVSSFDVNFCSSTVLPTSCTLAIQRSFPGDLGKRDVFSFRHSPFGNSLVFGAVFTNFILFLSYILCHCIYFCSVWDFFRVIYQVYVHASKFSCFFFSFQTELYHLVLWLLPHFKGSTTLKRAIELL